jgi:HEAT repeat protein
VKGKLAEIIKYNFFLFSCLFFASFAFFAGNSFAQTPEQIKFYSERIEFGTEEVKRNALFDLRNFQTEAASRIALPALKDPSEIVRATATHTVVYLPKDESAQALLPLLNEKAEFIRRETAYALGKTRNPNVANELIEVLQKDKKQSVRDAAAVSLGLVGNPIALQSLSNILTKKPKDSKRLFRRVAARSIGQIAETIQPKVLTFETPEDFLPTKYKQIENVTYKDLVQTNPAFRPVISKLVISLQNRKEFPDVKREAAFALGAIGSKSAITVLQANLNNEDYYLAEICKEALLKINN